MKKKLLFLPVLLAFAMVFMGCGDETGAKTEKIVFGDVSWDSVQVHNRVAAFIIENGMDGSYEIDYMPGDTLHIINGVTRGDIDVDMESWHSNFPEVYASGIESGKLIDLGKNMPDAPQGWWVPRYLVEGDASRGIEALAPNLKSLSDLPQYWELFKDPEDSSKGIILIGTAGWTATEISEGLFNEYGLGDTYNKGIPGSGSALAASMVGSYEKGEPWVGYYWAPTAVLGRLDMIRLEGSEFEPADVNILINSSMTEKAPEVVAFLRNYSTSVNDNNEFLAVMEAENYDSSETALWFLLNKKDVWSTWITDEQIALIDAALENQSL